MRESIKLTQTVSCGGCAGKMNPGDLNSILGKLSNSSNPNLLVGFDKGDDACVYKLNDETGIVSTVDFIAPLIDDPFDFGRVAAANALSDIYAMGAVPTTALNVVYFDNRLGAPVLEKILLGAEQVCKEANTILGGGHTVTAPEIRFGLSVNGLVNPSKIIRNSNGRPKDTLIITKPIGTGILCQALKYDLLDDDLSSLLVNQLTELNDKVGRVMRETEIRCATDITGFGLAGHLHILAKSSNCAAQIHFDKIPLLPKILELATDNIHSGIVSKNQEFVSNSLINETNSEVSNKILFDPQTNGGILIAVSQEKVGEIKSCLEQAGCDYWEIGELVKGTVGTIKIL